MNTEASSTAETESTFATLLDEDGLLRKNEAVDGLATERAPLRFYVFSQQADARFLATGLDEHATRFLGGKLGLTVAKNYRGSFPKKDVARFVVFPTGGIAATLLVVARPKTDDDRRRAEDAAIAMNGGNMDAVAARCPTVYEVYAADAEEHHALLLAAALSSTLLGPIVDPRDGSIFAVRTARERIAALTESAYR